MSDSAFTVTGTASGGGTVTTVATGTGLTGGPITTSGTISMANTAVTPASYTNTNLTVDQQGRITAASNGTNGTITSIATGTGLTGGPITTSGTIALSVPVVVADGGTGDISFSTPYGVVCAGITGTDPLQNIANVGTMGQVLTSNGPGSLPSFQAGGSGGGATAGVVGSAVNLLGATSGGTKTAMWSADQLIAWTALNGLAYVGSSLSLAFNGATTGAGGMDTGSTPTSSSLYIYAIFDPTTPAWSTLGTTAGSGASIYGGSNMPAGYTASALIWSGVTDGNTNFFNFIQWNRLIYIAPVTVLNITSGTGATPYAPLLIPTVIPYNANSIQATIGSPITGGTRVAVSGNITGLGQQLFVGGNGLTSGLDAYGYSEAWPVIGLFITPGTQTFYYRRTAPSGANSTVRIDISGYTF